MRRADRLELEFENFPLRWEFYFIFLFLLFFFFFSKLCWNAWEGGLERQVERLEGIGDKQCCKRYSERGKFLESLFNWKWNLEQKEIYLLFFFLYYEVREIGRN